MKPWFQIATLSCLFLLSSSVIAWGSISTNVTVHDNGTINYGSTPGGTLRFKSSYDSPVALSGSINGLPATIVGGDISPFSWSNLHAEFYYAGATTSDCANVIESIPSSHSNGPTTAPPGSTSTKMLYQKLGGTGYSSSHHNELEVWELDGAANPAYPRYLANMKNVYVSTWWFLPTTYNLYPGGWHSIWSDRETGNTGATRTYDYAGATLDDMFSDILYISSSSAHGFYWTAAGVHYQGQGAPFEPYTWQEINWDVKVPKGRWFHIEIYLERSEDKGVFKVWLDGQTLFDISNSHPPSSMPFGVVRTSLGNHVHRINLTKLYSSAGVFASPMEMWNDDVEIWDGIP